MAPTLELIPPTDASLNKRAAAVQPNKIVSPGIQGVIDRMLELAAGKGYSKHDTRQMVGLAAPQLGCRQRIITLDMTADGSLKEQHLQVVLNPVITHYSNKKVPGREGCWSCGNICGNVERAESITLEGLDRDGHLVQFELAGFVARIAQHEVDHLDGVRFPDRIPEDEPEKLHWVEPEQFVDYRLNWAAWPHRCPRDKWLAIKEGNNDDAAEGQNTSALYTVRCGAEHVRERGGGAGDHPRHIKGPQYRRPC